MDKKSIIRQNAKVIDGADIRSLVGSTVMGISTQFAFTCISLRLPDGRLCDIEVSPGGEEPISTKMFLYNNGGDRINLSGEVHCEYCQCPVEIWKPDLKTYKGDECKLYAAFYVVIDDLEDAKKPFTNDDIMAKCRTNFEGKYTDIEDFEATINEMINIHYA